MTDETIEQRAAGVAGVLNHRPRRLRRTAAMRELFTEIRLHRADVVVPVFVVPGNGVRREVGSMPGVFQESVDVAADRLVRLADRGFRSFIVFGVIPASEKDADGGPALDGDNVVCRLVREVRRRDISMVAITDLCFCEYTDHGHCGPLTAGAEVDNDATLKRLAVQAARHADAGADLVAPSGCMDGMVAAIRGGLDAAGHTNTGVMSYAVKYASGFYGPFRDAADSAPSFGDRRSYQMDPARGLDEAIDEATTDQAEGADCLIVKPAGPYLDVIQKVRAAVTIPVVAYQTSAEYAMHVAAEQAGWIDADRVVLESLLSIRRAGATATITYHIDRLDRLLPE